MKGSDNIKQIKPYIIYTDNKEKGVSKQIKVGTSKRDISARYKNLIKVETLTIEYEPSNIIEILRGNVTHETLDIIIDLFEYTGVFK